MLTLLPAMYLVLRSVSSQVSPNQPSVLDRRGGPDGSARP